MPSYEPSMRNLAKARARGRPARPWRSNDESRMIQRFVLQWFTCRGKRPSGRSWARDLGISHTWFQKLVRRFQTDPRQMLRHEGRTTVPVIRNERNGKPLDNPKGWFERCLRKGKITGVCWHCLRHYADRLTIPVKTSAGPRIHVTV